MRILFIGDIVGRPGRDLVRRAVPSFADRHGIDLVIANVENVAGGFGVTRETGEALLKSRIDVMTTGNHVWDRKEVVEYLEREARLLRPINYPKGVPGRGSFVAKSRSGEPAAIINAMGRVFMTPLDNPFVTTLDAAASLKPSARIIIVDFHAEATSEKMAMGWYLDGKVTAVVGTHTHVQTADERILPQGTAYITDVGMTGPHDSVIGVTVETALPRLLTGVPERYQTATENPRLNAVIITADERTGRATAIERLNATAHDLDMAARPGNQ
jgi:metallophosphoesterase (TIGR00282 family)